MPNYITINNNVIPLIPDYSAPSNTFTPINQAGVADYTQPDSRQLQYAEVTPIGHLRLNLLAFGGKIRILGSGGTAEVYRAKLANTDVALKKFKAPPEFFNPEYRDEKSTDEKLKHPNIIQLIGYIETPGGFMPW